MDKKIMDTWDNDPFFQYPKSVISTSEGNVTLPILYYDNSNMIAVFYVDYNSAQAMVEPHHLTAIHFSGGKALVGIAFYEYRNSSINPYNEVGVAIAALPNGTIAPKFPLLSLFYSLDKYRVGLYIVDLPVTTDTACAAGKEIWGYPKFVTSISFELIGRKFNGSVRHPDSSGSLLTMSGNAGLGISGPLLDLVLYSSHQGKTLRTLVNTRGGGRISLPGSIRLQAGDSDHPMRDRLIKLGLKDAKPAFVSYSHTLQSRLNAGAVMPRQLHSDLHLQ
jgi:Acetoacetate decarboxylase (ADC)